MSKKSKSITDVDMEDVHKLVDKYSELTREKKLDLSADEDLSVGIMNLISIEEHLFFSGAKTGKTKYYEVLNQVREMRKGLLKRIIKDYEGEVWCISKHLLAGSYRLMECGTKQLSKGEADEAADIFAKAYGLYSLFWGMVMGIVQSDEIDFDPQNEPKD